MAAKWQPMSAYLRYHIKNNTDLNLEIKTSNDERLSSRSTISLYSCPSLKSKKWIEYKPTNHINDTSAINFSITLQSSAYIDLKRSVLNVKLRLTNGDGTPLNEETTVGLVNAPLHSIFRQGDVTFQQTPLSHSGNNYSYKPYIDSILKNQCEYLERRTDQSAALQRCWNRHGRCEIRSQLGIV